MNITKEFYTNLLVALLIITFILALICYYKKYLYNLQMYFILVTSLPFIHLATYYDFDYSQNYEILWGLAANKWMHDEVVISELLSLAVVWISSLVMFSLRKKIYIHDYTDFKKINIKFIFLFLLLCIFFSWSSAPKDTLFTAVYMASDSNLNMNVSSLWAFSYMLFIVTYINIDIYHKKLKVVAILTLIIISLYYGLLRGDRESLTLLLSIFIYETLHKKTFFDRKLAHPNFKLIASIVFIVFFVNGIVGGLRHSLITTDTEVFSLADFHFSNLIHGTWSAVLLTPLSVIYEQSVNNQDFKLGTDYFNMFLSFPPGVVSDLFGYERPWNSESGPAKEMIFGLGGVHVTVLPIRNFGILGVIAFAFFYSRIIYSFEKYVLRQRSAVKDAFYISMFMIIPHWTWYSDKILLNHIVYLLILFLVTRFTIEKIKPNSRYSNNSQ